ncbi:hypothetical protein BDR04DRAFT_1127720 [Suillus decipiens]|nr:hypothetical protein BDR04DRAFT_1127720 [Suillus decipiens]
MREFTQENAYTKHQRSCAKGKKQLFSALSKAKDLLGSAKRARLDANGGRQDAHVSMESSSMQLHHPQLLSLPSDHANKALSEQSSNVYSAEYPTLEVPSPAEVDDDSSLAQCRTQHVDVQMPLHYQQCEDILPQPPPSIPSQVAPLREFNLPSNPSNMPTMTYMLLQSTPFHMARNVFGLIHQFFSSTPPSHDPEEATMLRDISSIPTVAAPDLDDLAEPHSPFYPYPNQSSFKLRHWYWNGQVQKSHQSFKELLDIVGCPDFDPGNVQHTHWDKINLQLGASVDNKGGDEWEDEDAGWHKMQVVIKGELYTSPAFMDVHCKLQASPAEAGCDLSHVVAALMFWSDATQLTTFSNMKLWLVYMYFRNESKYHCCRPSCYLGNHLAYFQKLPDSFKDFMGTYTEGKGIGHKCTTHCHCELFQAQWKVLLDDKFLEAYKYGIVILCCDGISYYPEKVLIATIRQLGGCPCSWCLIPMKRFHCLGTSSNRQQCVTLACSNTSRSQLVATAQDLIYKSNLGVDSVAVELLKSNLWFIVLPSLTFNENTFLDSLSSFRFNIFIALVVNLLHKVELGVWQMLLVHLLRILTTLNKDLIHEVDRRYRQVPPFGLATIRRFSSHTSEMYCSIPVFDSLFPDTHNKIIISLLFTLSHWHGLAKLRMHSDLTLKIPNKTTTNLGEQFHLFKEMVCISYHMQELDREVDARSHQQAKEAAKQAGNGKGKGKEKTEASPEQSQNVPRPKQPWKKKSFNIQTYKFHALGDYVASIHLFGTMDSYSTKLGELELCMLKGRYRCTDKRAFVHEMASDPQLHHHISQSERMFDELGQYLCNHFGDPAIKDFLPQLKEHILNCLEPEIAELLTEILAPSDQDNSILFKCNQLYHHNLTRFNYTTYDVHRAQDVVNPWTPHCNIMLLKHHNDDGHSGEYCYAKVIGIHHVNVWYKPVQDHTWDTSTLGCIHLQPLAHQNVFGFIDPAVVLRACHIIPVFSQHQCNPGECGISPLAGDKHDWPEYYVNSFVDWDTLMRFHYGLGTSHVYSHKERAYLITHTTAWTENEPLGSPANDDDDDEQDDDRDHVGTEELDFFDQGLNASTESLTQVLYEMFMTSHTFDYEN